MKRVDVYIIPIRPTRWEKLRGRFWYENGCWLSSAVIGESRVDYQVSVITRRSRLLEVMKSITRLTLFLIDHILMSAADMRGSWISYADGLGWECVEVVCPVAVKMSKEVNVFRVRRFKFTEFIMRIYGSMV